MAGPQVFLDGKVTLHSGDCREVIRSLPDSSIDSVVTDPPYALVSIVKRFANSPRSEATENTENPYGRTGRGFMGQLWDNGETAFAAEFWAEVLRVLKPGGHVVSFSGTRTYHRMAVAIEDAGFEIRDQLAWMYGSGFPKSHDVSKGIDKAAGAVREVVGTKETGSDLKPDNGNMRFTKKTFQDEDGKTVFNITAPATDAARQWQGWGTALKPAWEPICLARKPLIGTVAANVLERGTGALNIDGCRVGTEGGARTAGGDTRTESQGGAIGAYKSSPLVPGLGRWPANIVHDGSDEVLAGFPESKDGVAGKRTGTSVIAAAGLGGYDTEWGGYGGEGSAARFFYTAKADKLDRIGSKHPTVKPVDLMQWLCRMVTPPGGLVLDPFAGSGSTGEAAWREGFRCILIEREAEYQADIARRMDLVLKPAKRSAVAKSKNKLMGAAGTPLFGGEAA